MEALTVQDTQKLLHAIEEIYSLHDLNLFGVKALAIVHQLVESELPAFPTANAQDQHSTAISGCFAHPSPQQISLRHVEEYPLTSWMTRVLENAYKISDFITASESQTLEVVYQQDWQSIGFEDRISLFLTNSPPQSWEELTRGKVTLAEFSFHLSQRNFTERDRLILNLLRPHLYQAYCNVQHYQQLQQELSQLQQSFNYLGLVTLDAKGQIQLIAPQVIVWLETYFSQPTSSHQLPDHLGSWVKHQIAELIKNPDLPKAGLPLRIQQESKELVIRLVVEQLGERYLLLLEEQTLSPMNSLALLGLSQRETEVLAWIMQGKENKTIATHLGVNVSTVRKHLENIYRKFGVHSRTEAIAQALEKLGILNSPSPLNPA